MAGLILISFVFNQKIVSNGLNQDNFDLENGHVIPALIRKIWEAKINHKPTFEVWGDGEIYREFIGKSSLVASAIPARSAPILIVLATIISIARKYKTIFDL